jgi:hypothetical protein
VATEKRAANIAELIAKHKRAAARMKLHRDAMQVVAQQARQNIDKQAESGDSQS